MRLPQELVNLVREHIETYEQLQVVVLIGRHPSRDWRAVSVEAALALPSGTGQKLLDHLARSGFLVRSHAGGGEVFRCHPDLALSLTRLTNPVADQVDRGSPSPDVSG